MEPASSSMLPTRVKHWIFKGVLPTIGNQIPVPEVVSGPGSLQELGAIASRLGMRKPLVVSDKDLVKLGLVKQCTDSLESHGMEYALYTDVEQNPHSGLVEDGYELYIREGCDGFVAIGGGSPMDCAKVIGCKVFKPKTEVSDFVGIAAVSGLLPAGPKRKGFPPFVALPTTAGSGSEATVAAVISFKEKGLKLAIADNVLIPRVAVLDPRLLAGLPPPIIAATGMDALTHAVESYVSKFATAFSKAHSLKAVERIGKYLLRCYHMPSDLEAREQMLIASFEAGVALTRVNLGYVHAIAHTLGSFFGVPHGVANAIVMPHVLEFYLDGVEDKLCDLAKAIGLPNEGTAEAERYASAVAFIAKVRLLSDEMQVPRTVSGMKDSDVDRVVTRALTEAHGEKWYNLLDFGYPVPKYMSHEDCAKVVRACLPCARSKL
jgi:alcohol dehydrogenase class IV